MTHTYLITGMTCTNCVAKVKNELLKIPEILSAEVTLNPGKAVIDMSHHISLPVLQQAISPEKKYLIAEDLLDTSHAAMTIEEKKSWLGTYKSLLLIFLYISIISLIAPLNNLSLSFNSWVNSFMAGFFLSFSFFKLLDLKGFAEGYATYDLLAKKWKPYGYVYPFIELFFGIALLTGFYPVIINGLIVAVMGFSAIGVVQSILKKQTIQCACLGTIFKLPLGKVTLLEDSLMMLMALFTIILMK